MIHPKAIPRFAALCFASVAFTVASADAGSITSEVDAPLSSPHQAVKGNGKDHRQLKSCSEDDTFFVIMNCDNVCGVRGLEFKAEKTFNICEFVSSDAGALSEARALGCPNVGGNFRCDYNSLSEEIKRGNEDIMCDFCSPPPTHPLPTVPPPTRPPPTRPPPTPAPPIRCSNELDALNRCEGPSEGGGCYVPSTIADCNDYRNINCHLSSTDFCPTFASFCPYGETDFCPEYQNEACESNYAAAKNCVANYPTNTLAGRQSGVVMNGCSDPSPQECVDILGCSQHLESMKSCLANHPECDNCLSFPDAITDCAGAAHSLCALEYQPNNCCLEDLGLCTEEEPLLTDCVMNLLPRVIDAECSSSIASELNRRRCQEMHQGVSDMDTSDPVPEPPNMPSAPAPSSFLPETSPTEEGSAEPPSSVIGDVESMPSTASAASSDCSTELRSLQLCAARACGEGCNIPNGLNDCIGWQSVECHLMSPPACCPTECTEEFEAAVSCSTEFYVQSEVMKDCPLVSSATCQNLVLESGPLPGDSSSGPSIPFVASLVVAWTTSIFIFIFA